MSATTDSPAVRHPALRYRDFNLLAFGRFCGTAGVQMLSVAIGWQVYDLTQDPFALGMVGLSQFLPALLLALHAGQLADQLDRARLNALTYLMITICSGGLFLLSWGGNHALWPIYSLAVILGVARITGAPAAKALLPNLVPTDAFSNAVALSAMAFQIATIGGPALGGALYALGSAAVYGTASVLLAVATLANFLIRTRSKGVKEPVSWESLSAGIRFIRAHPVVLGAISLDLFAVLFGGVVALLPIYAKDILHVGPLGLGILRAAPAAGAAIMAIVLAHYPLRHKAGRKLLIAVITYGTLTALFGLSENFFLSLGLLVALGSADMISVYIRSHLVQMATPDHLRGRVGAVNMLFITTSNELGEFESGVTASWFGVIPATILGGVLAITTAGLCAWRIPELRKADTLVVKG